MGNKHKTPKPKPKPSSNSSTGKEPLSHDHNTTQPTAAAATAVLDFVTTGVYPTEDEAELEKEEEHVNGSGSDKGTLKQNSSSTLSTNTLEALAGMLAQARADVQTSLRELSALSSSSAADVDSWLAQARQARADRDASVAEAAELARRHQSYTEFQASQRDSAAQLALLDGEVAFTAGLQQALQAIQETKQTLARAQSHLENGQLLKAAHETQTARERIEADRLGPLNSTSALDLLVQRAAEQSEAIWHEASAAWDRFVQADRKTRSIVITRSSGNADLDSIVQVLEQIGLLPTKIASLDASIQELILQPRLESRSSAMSQIATKGNSIALVFLSSKDGSVSKLFSEILELRKFFGSVLPEKAGLRLSRRIIPRVQRHLLNVTLPAVVPADIDGLQEFQATLQNVSSFVEQLNSSGWHETQELTNWVDSAPKVWLQTKSADALTSLRQVLKRGLGNPRSVERVETQTIIEGEDLLAPENSTEDWNDQWSDNDDFEGQESRSKQVTAKNSTLPSATAVNADEEDASGWGWDDEGEEPHDTHDTLDSKPPAETPNDEEEDDGGVDAWDNWEDDADRSGAAAAKATSVAKPSPKKQVKAAVATAPVEKVMTLRESYHITALPEQILEVLIMLVEDADRLSASQDHSNPVTHAAPSLYALPGTLLALFRAAAPTAYGSNESGNMYLYNDCQYLAEQLTAFSEHHTSRQSGQGSLDLLILQPDITALQVFGRRTYAREMEAQRTILGDLLDGAQGFANCTEAPYAEQCDVAVSSTVDRIRQVHAQWRDVLSPSTLLQATGSLLSTVVSKIIVDVEDLSDIGEAESARLQAHCTAVSQLEDLFLPAAADSEVRLETAAALREGEEAAAPAAVPSTAVYVPAWLKFQYLSTILESSLADIKYLWGPEGGLALEYSADELVDLVEALFADSPRRREAISEIRGSGGG